MIDHILNAIDEELTRLREARDLLTAGEPSPAKTAKTRTLSPKARRAIADAQRRRWARVRRQKTSAAS